MKDIFKYPNDIGTHYIDPNYVGDATSGFEKRVNDLRTGAYKAWDGTVPPATTDAIMENMSKFHGQFYENWGENTIYKWHELPIIVGTTELLQESIISATGVNPTPSNLAFASAHDLWDGILVTPSNFDGSWADLNGQDYYVKVVDTTNIQLTIDAAGTLPITFYDLQDADIVSASGVDPAANTLTFTSPHGFADETLVTISGFDGSWSEFNGNQYYVQVVDPNTMNLSLDAAGTLPIYFHDIVELGNITSADGEDPLPLLFTFSSPHGLSSGTHIRLEGFDGSVGSFNGATAYVQVVDATSMNISTDQAGVNLIYFHDLGDASITSATATNPAVFTDSNHDLKTGMLVDISNFDGSIGDLWNNQQFYAQVIDSSTFNLSWDAGGTNLLGLQPEVTGVTVTDLVSSGAQQLSATIPYAPDFPDHTQIAFDYPDLFVATPVGGRSVLCMSDNGNIAFYKDGNAIKEYHFDGASWNFIRTVVADTTVYDINGGSSSHASCNGAGTRIVIDCDEIMVVCDLVGGAWSVTQVIDAEDIDYSSFPPVGIISLHTPLMSSDGNHIITNMTEGGYSELAPWHLRWNGTTWTSTTIGQNPITILAVIDTGRKIYDDLRAISENGTYAAFARDWTTAYGLRQNHDVAIGYYSGSGAWQLRDVYTHPDPSNNTGVSGWYWKIKGLDITNDGNMIVVAFAKQNYTNWDPSGFGSITLTTEEPADVRILTWDPNTSQYIDSGTIAPPANTRFWGQYANISPTGNSIAFTYDPDATAGGPFYVRRYELNGSWVNTLDAPYSGFDKAFVSDNDSYGHTLVGETVAYYDVAGIIIKNVINTYGTVYAKRSGVTDNYLLFTDFALSLPISYTTMSEGLGAGTPTATVTATIGFAWVDSTVGNVDEIYTSPGPNYYVVQDFTPSTTGIIKEIYTPPGPNYYPVETYTASTTGKIIEVYTPPTANIIPVVTYADSTQGTITASNALTERYRVTGATAISYGNKQFLYRDVNGNYQPGAVVYNTYAVAGDSETIRLSSGPLGLSVTTDGNGRLNSISFTQQDILVDSNSDGILFTIAKEADTYVAPTQTTAEQQDNWDLDTEWDTQGFASAKEWPHEVSGGVTPKSAKLTYTQPSSVTASQSGIKYVRNLGFQAWELEVEYPPLTEEQFRLLHVTAQNARGQFTPFYFINRDAAGNPLVLDYHTPGVTTQARYKEAVSAGDTTFLLEGYGSNQVGAVRAGELMLGGVSNNGNISTMMVDVTSNAYGEAKIKIPYGTPNSPAVGSSVYFDPYHFIVTLADDAFEYEIDTFGFYYVKVTFNLDRWK